MTRPPMRPERAPVPELTSEGTERLRGLPPEGVVQEALTPPEDPAHVATCDPAVYPELVE